MPAEHARTEVQSTGKTKVWWQWRKQSAKVRFAVGVCLDFHDWSEDEAHQSVLAMLIERERGRARLCLGEWRPQAFEAPPASIEVRWPQRPGDRKRSRAPFSTSSPHPHPRPPRVW